jgi:hypothetical protein
VRIAPKSTLTYHARCRPRAALERGGDGGERHDRVGVGEDAHPSIMLSTVVSRDHDFERGGHGASGGPRVEIGEEPS